MKKHLPWIIGTIAFAIIALLAAIGVAYFGIKSSIESAKPAVPMADLDNPMEQVTFDDDYTLKILNIGETSIMDGSKKLIGRTSGGVSMSSSSSTSIGWTLISLTHYQHDDSTIGLKFEANEGNLLLELQLLSDTHEPVIHSDWIANSSFRTLSGKNGSIFQNHQTYLESDPSKNLQPQVISQLQDRTGGWITARGPYNDGKDKELRSVVAFEAWPRDSKTLKFRFIRYGSDPKYFQLENPFYVDPAKAKPFVTQTLPLSHKGIDFSLTLNKVTEHYHPELGRFIEPYFITTTSFPKNRRRENEINIRLKHIVDPLGGLHYLSNYSQISDNQAPNMQAFPFPAHLKQAKLVYTISQGSSYPRTFSDTNVIAEAEVADNGFELNLTNHTKSYGIQSVTFGQILTDLSGEKYTEVSVKGMWASATQKALANAAGISIDDHLVAFVNKAKVSSGHSGYAGSVLPATTGSYSFNKRYYRDFKPGDKITFAVCKKQPDQEVTFTIDLPKAREIVEGATDPNEDS